MGWHPAPPIEYEGDYWDEYRERDATEMGKALTDARIALVDRHFHGSVVDIGIGGGRFVEDSGSLGYDVNPKAVKWLVENARWMDVYIHGADAITCWDSIEHIPDPMELLKRVRKWVFVSLPIMESPEHCLKSRHYKPGEHIWYWTHQGFVEWMKKAGFECVETNAAESDLGRDGITSYAFRRVEWPL